MEKIIGILIVLFVVGTTMQSCSGDSKEEENFLQKIDPVEQLEVLNTNREKELVVNFVRKTYVKDLQIEIAYRRIDTGKTQEWSIVLLNGNDVKYKNGANYLQVADVFMFFQLYRGGLRIKIRVTTVSHKTNSPQCPPCPLW